MQNPRLELSQRTGLMMTPMMQQAVAILLMSTLELEQHVEQELETNPTLDELNDEEIAPDQEPTEEARKESAEAEEAAGGDGGDDFDFELAPPPKTEPSSETSEPEPSGELDFENLFSSEPIQETRESGGENIIEATMTQEKLLSDHLLEQLSMVTPAPEVERAARYLISRLNEDGFLVADAAEVLDANVSAAADPPAEEPAIGDPPGPDPAAAPESAPVVTTPVESGPFDAIASAEGIPRETLGAALELIRSFDPPGVGARDAQESLLLQLERLGRKDSIPYVIVRDHFDDLARNRLPAIARTLMLEMRQVTEAIEDVRHLEPRPGRAFGASETTYIVPDVVVEKINGEYIVSLRNDRIPQLRISEYYRRMFEREKRKKGEVSDYLKQKLESAYWLIRSIEQRQNTIYRVSDSIVRHQIDFLEYGQKYLKPMTLRVVAEDLGIHESTVSRVTTQKYMQTPRGTFELKYFFTSSIETSSGEDASSRAVKTVLQEILAGEDTSNPYSDQKLSELLAGRGYHIARRTVTKYREQLNIRPAKERIKY